MLIAADGFFSDLRHLQRLREPLAAHQFHHNAVAVHDDERRGQHRKHHAGKNRVEHFIAYQLVLLRQREQHKTEFACLGKIQACAQSRAITCTQEPRQHSHHHQLKQHWQEREQQHQRPALQHNAPIEQHANRDEEKPEQHIVKRANIGFHLMFVFRLRHEHARDKSAKRERQACVLGEISEPQRHEQQIEHKKLFALAPRHQGEPPSHDFLPTCEQDRYQKSRFQRSDTQCGR